MICLSGFVFLIGNQTDHASRVLVCFDFYDLLQFGNG